MIAPVNLESYIRYKLQKSEQHNDLRIVQEIERMFNCDGLRLLFSSIENYMDRVIEALEEHGYTTIFDGRLALKTRLIIHLRNLPLELSVPWDPYWNLPYIPAATLRDALKAAAQQISTNCRVDFGTLETPSTIAVLDAYPVQCPCCQSLVTVDYVEEEGMCELSGIKQLPILTVSSNTAFRIVLLVRKENLSCPEDKFLDALYLLIKIALKRGVGALTSLGYGAFNINAI
jgi:CRISPR-associated protein Cmr6